MINALDWSDLREQLSLPREHMTPYTASQLALRPRLFGALVSEAGSAEPGCRKRCGPASLPERLAKAASASCHPRFMLGDLCDRIAITIFFVAACFVLPLRWVQGQSHSLKLPAALAQMAEDVARVCLAILASEEGSGG